VFVDVGSYTSISSWSENLINIGSWVEGLPIVVSVPKWIKCLSLSDTLVKTVAVGLPATIVARVLTPVPAVGFHEKVCPSLIVAINNSPKLSNDQLPASMVVLETVLEVPQRSNPHVPAPHP